MSALSDVVNVTITAEVANPTRAGFGVPLILANTAQTQAWVARVREYASRADAAVDFAEGTPELMAIDKLFGQSPRPEKVLVGKGALPFTQRWALTPVAINGHTYKARVKAKVGLVWTTHEVSFTADSSALASEIIAGLKAAIDLLALDLTTSDQTTFLRIVADNPGEFFSVEIDDFAAMALAQDHADPGVATDLSAINLERSDWFFLLTIANSKAVVDAAAAWAQANGKMYVVQTSDSAVPNTVLSGTDDVGESLKNAAVDATLLYSPGAADFLDAGLVGRVAPYTPGEETWWGKTLQGCPTTTYTGTQRANLRAKNVNFYEVTAGIPTTKDGIASSGKYGDFLRYLAFQRARIAERVFGRMAAPAKVPYNDRGIAIVENEVRGQLGEDTAREALLEGWSVSVPKAATVSSADRTARVLRNVNYSCVYAGAVHKVLINGVVAL